MAHHSPGCCFCSNYINAAGRIIAGFGSIDFLNGYVFFMMSQLWHLWLRIDASLHTMQIHPQIMFCRNKKLIGLLKTGIILQR